MTTVRAAGALGYAIKGEHLKVAVSITLSIEAPDAKTGQQIAAAFCEPAIRQLTGQQVPKVDGVWDVDAMKAFAAEAIRKVFTGPFLTEKANQLEVEKQAALEAARQQATQGMTLDVTIG